MNKRLLIRNFPQDFGNADKVDFLQLFGATDVLSFPDNGKMKLCCFATFPDVSTAKQAILSLHQFEILDKRLVVEYAKPVHSEFANHIESKKVLDRTTFIPDGKQEKGEKNNDQEKQEIDSGMNPKLNVHHSFPAHLNYRYPDPNVAILTNIANALACVPKFYTQVLHLMNKMNLPPPFTGATLTPPLQGDSVLLLDASVDTSDLCSFVSSDESEIESDSETDKKHEIYTGSLLSTEPMRKRKRLKTVAKAEQEKFETTTKQKRHGTVESTFELGSSSKRFEFSLAASIKEAVDKKSQPAISYNVFDERGEFGKIQPVHKEQSDNEDEDMEDISEDYVSFNQLKDNRIAEKEILLMAQFKNYAPGENTNRLYVKNLAKQVVEDDLQLIYKRFVRNCTDEDKALLEIRLMQEGRMKGQAFITLPSEEIANKALKQTHGYILHNKPMVVQYGRAGKSK